MIENKTCPGCRRHCNLNDLFCERGKEYLRTGKLPKHTHEGNHHRGNRMEHYHNASMNDKLIMNLRDISHMMRRQYEGKASQKRILIILHESGTLTQKKMTERLGIQPGSTSEILSKLENAGLITRTPNEADRRTTDIKLTDAGAKLALEAVEQRQKRHQEMFLCLSSEEREMLLSLLEKIYTDWETRFSGRHNHQKENDGQGNCSGKQRSEHSCHNQE